jgi:ABC-2 type transport system permease protein
MSMLRQTYELARRDFLQRAKSRAFLVAMLVTVGLVLSVGPLIALTTREPDPSVIGIVGETQPGVPAAVLTQAAVFDIDVVTEMYTSRSVADQALAAGSADVLVIDGTYLVWQDEARPRLAAVVSGAIAQLDRQQIAADLGLDPEDLSRLLSPPPLATRVVEEPDPEKEPRQAAAYAGLFVLYISILMFGQFVLMGVMEEKQNRVVEVVLSRVRPTQVLTGKVIGIGLLGLIQILALGASGLFMVTVIDVADVDLSAIGIEIFLGVLFWYLLGYAFYSMLYGALGATVSRQEDMQGAVMVPVLMIIPGFFFGQVATESPDTLMAKIGSLVPLWSPMVMPVRSAVSEVPLWEVGLAVLFLILGIYGLVRFGGRIYTGAILKIGSKVRLREAWRAARS